MSVSVTQEAKDELRRLHAEHRDITKTIAHFEPVTAGIPDDLAAQYERTTDAVLGLVHLHMGDLLDALAAAEAELKREEHALGRTIHERDMAEKALGEMYAAVIGHPAEWSNRFGYGDALEAVRDHLAAAEARIQALQIELIEAQTARDEMEERLQCAGLDVVEDGTTGSLQGPSAMTASPTALLTLAAECEAATGPDRELDARVLVALGILAPHEMPGARPGQTFKRGEYVVDLVESWSIESYGRNRHRVEPLTASVDAAFALLAAVLPDWRAKILATRSAGCSADVELWDEGGRLLQISSGNAPTLPLAIVAAVLRAVAARDDAT